VHVPGFMLSGVASTDWTWDSSLYSGGATYYARAAGFGRPQRIEIPARVITRTIDDTVAAVFSLSSSTPRRVRDRTQSASSR